MNEAMSCTSTYTYVISIGYWLKMLQMSHKRLPRKTYETLLNLHCDNTWLPCTSMVTLKKKNQDFMMILLITKVNLVLSMYIIIAVKLGIRISFYSNRVFKTNNWFPLSSLFPSISYGHKPTKIKKLSLPSLWCFFVSVVAWCLFYLSSSKDYRRLSTTNFIMKVFLVELLIRKKLKIHKELVLHLP